MYVGHRSHRTQFLPLFVQRRWRKVGITFGRLMKFSRYGSRKRKIPLTQRSDDFVGWNGGKMNRVCCGAVDLSGIIHGEAVFKMNTTTSCGKVQTNPQEQWDLQEKYHCVWKSSRGFWKICWSEARKVWHILWLLVALGKIRYVNQNKSHFLSAVNSSTASCNRMLLVHSRRRRQ